MHFLIHPGFIAESEEACPGEGCVPSHASGDEMFRRYSQRARAMSGNEVVIALSHKELQDVVADARRGRRYAVLLLQLQRQIGSQMVLLTQHGSVTNAQALADDFAVAKELLAQRGYTYHPDVESTAYGETLLCCVVQCAERLNTAAGLKRPTVIDTGGCDVNIAGGVESAEMVDQLKEFQGTLKHIELPV